jgi:hypothetical protein
MQSTKCRFKGVGLKNKKYNPGDIIHAPWLAKNALLSPEYKKDHLGKRPPVLICLPNNRLWSPDLCAAEDTSGWLVEGVLPLISIMPSVVCIQEQVDGTKENTIYRIMNGVICEEKKEIVDASIS